MSEMEKRMHEGKLFFPEDESIAKAQLEAQELLYDFNQTRPSELKKRRELMKQMFAKVGDDCYIEPPLHANFGGKFTHIGKGVYANYNLTLVDDTEIYIGDNCLFGPNVVLATANHPIEKELRAKKYQYNLPIRLGNNVWLGAGVIVLPGITIGDNTVIGAGSIVTHDIEANVIAVGNPCRVLRKISERDKEYYYKDLKIDL